LNLPVSHPANPGSNPLQLSVGIPFFSENGTIEGVFGELRKILDAAEMTYDFLPWTFVSVGNVLIIAAEGAKKQNR